MRSEKIFTVSLSGPYSLYKAKLIKPTNITAAEIIIISLRINCERRCLSIDLFLSVFCISHSYDYAGLIVAMVLESVAFIQYTGTYYI